MYEKYWQQAGEKTSVVMSGWQSMSYFSDVSNICWFLESKFAKEVIRVHKIVGNAVTEGRHMVVGTGSTQLFQAALYPLSSLYGAEEPQSVVSAMPYYSAVSDSCEHGSDIRESNNFFEISYHLIAERWNRLQEAVEHSGMFSTPSSLQLSVSTQIELLEANQHLHG